MSLIDESYFIGQITIPDTGSQAVSELLQWYIDKYEPLFLQKLMGYPLYKAYLAAPTDARFLNLLNGSEYIDSTGYTARWPGLLSTSPNPTSPIANYVYYWYMCGQTTQTTRMGEVLPAGQNSTTASPKKKALRAWNEMAAQVEAFYDFLSQQNYLSPMVYPEWMGYNWGFYSDNSLAFSNPYF